MTKTNDILRKVVFLTSVVYFLYGNITIKCDAKVQVDSAEKLYAPFKERHAPVTYLLSFAVGNDPLRYYSQLAIQYHLASLSLGITGEHLSALDVSGSLVHMGIWFDKFFSEPFVVPYFSYGFPIESSSKVEQSPIKFGILFQLNWIEPDYATKALFDYGLENSFVDIFWTTYDLHKGTQGNSINFGFTMQF
ncbi:MAG: hypothetical protein NZ480_06330 [Bdellovibrionaceae bacterium]|nr:hypothetical protein [Pseudobdellovibrionaceae bacterium]